MAEKENVSPCRLVNGKDDRIAQFARGSQTPASPEDEEPAHEMFDMAFSPPPRRRGTRRRVTFVKQEEIGGGGAGEDPSKRTLRERRKGTPARQAISSTEEEDLSEKLLSKERQKLERYEALAQSCSEAAAECSSPAPWRLLPRRESLTPRDIESRDAARHLAALRLQTLLHRRRAQRAFAKTAKLERAERERQPMVASANALETRLEATEAVRQRLESMLAETTAESAKRLESTLLRAEIAEEKIVALELELEAMRTQQHAFEAEARAAAEAVTHQREERMRAEVREAAAEADARACDAERALRQASAQFAVEKKRWDAKRKSLHDKVVELRGNVRTFVRVRPPLEVGASTIGGNEHGARIVVKCPVPPQGTPADSIELPESVAPGGPPRKPRAFKFTFDRVFPNSADQADVFAEVLPFVQSAIDGRAVCVFAYGQTGSGKTYTTIGTEHSPGILGRALDAVFLLGPSQDQQQRVCLEMLEIYLDKIYDLLAPQGDAIPLDILTTADQNCVIKGQTSLPVASPADAQAVLTRAHARRKVGATRANDTSSRSHCLITIRLPESGGVFNLVDLAGSERLKVSQADSTRLKETQFINASLSALANCVAALKHGHKHVPFRDSKLTFLLQPYLGGNNKTLALVAVAPEKQHERETLCSLRFAQQVSKVVPITKCPK